MNDAVWTDWIENPGTGECPVPEWAAEAQCLREDGKILDDNGLRAWFPPLACAKGCGITHYRYAVPGVLAWLAQHVNDWPLKHLGHVTRSGYALFALHKMAAHESYTEDQWRRARNDLGYVSGLEKYRRFCEGYGTATPEEQEEWERQDTNNAPSKYHRNVKGVWVDVYEILHAFEVTNPGDQHAVKKMLQPGKRGHKGAKQDRKEAIVSLKRANELEGEG